MYVNIFLIDRSTHSLTTQNFNLHITIEIHCKYHPTFVLVSCHVFLYIHSIFKYYVFGLMLKLYVVNKEKPKVNSCMCSHTWPIKPLKKRKIK